MDKLSKDELYLIALELDLPSLLNLCQSNKQMQMRICNNTYMWIDKLKEDFRYIFFPQDNPKTAKDMYKILYNISKSNYSHHAIESIFFDVIKLNSFEFLKFVMNNLGLPKGKINNYLSIATRIGNLQMIQLFLEMGAEKTPFLLVLASESGNVDVAKLFYNQIALNSALAVASTIEMAEFLISKGANDFDTALSYIIDREDELLLNFYLNSGLIDNWKKYLKIAKKLNKLKMIKLIKFND